MAWILRSGSVLLLGVASILAVVRFISDPGAHAQQIVRFSLFPLDPAAEGLACAPDTVPGALICRADGSPHSDAEWPPVGREALVFSFARQVRAGERATVTVGVEDPQQKLVGHELAIRLEGEGSTVRPDEQRFGLRDGVEVTFEVIARGQGQLRLLAQLVSPPVSFLRIARPPFDLDAVRLERYPNEILDIEVRSRFWALGLNQNVRAAVMENAWPASAAALAGAVGLGIAGWRRRRVQD